MSSNLSKRIAKGDISAYKELYSENAERVFYINYLLLCDEASAIESTKAVFKSAFSELSSSPEKADGFSNFIEKKAVTYCKIKLAKNNSKDFSIPASKNFMNFECSDKTLISDVNAELLVLANLPSLHRFIFVCGAYLNWMSGDIAQIIHTDAKTVALARDAEEANVAKVARALSAVSRKSVSESVSELLSLLEDSQGALGFNKNIDESIIRVISDAVAPAMAKRKKESKKKLLISAVILAIVVLIAGIVCCVICCNGEDGDTLGLANREKRDYTVPYNDKEITHYATVEMEDYGTIKLALCGTIAPKTVENFEMLANKGFYDGLTLHRIIEGFMMQGGDPKADGTGGNEDANGKEINIKGEFTVNGHANSISHKRGVISMARNGYDYDSASSQFFIVHEDYPSLDGKYASFGYVVEGMHVVDFICEDAQPIDDNGTIAPKDQPIIKSIRVTAAK